MTTWQSELGYSDYQIGNVTISRVYYVEGLGYNLFFVCKFCYSNLKVAFRQHTCFIRNLKGVDLLTGSRGNNLYTLSLGDMMAVPSTICPLVKRPQRQVLATAKIRCLSHLNFSAINHLARHGSLFEGLPKLKFEKGPSVFLHVQWAKTKEETPQNLNLKTTQLKKPLHLLHRIRTDNGAEFVNQTLREYYEKLDISHETSVTRSPQQNCVKAVPTACYTLNCSVILLRHNKTPYELLHDKLPDLSFFHVFGALYYPTNDSENLGKLQPKADIDFDELTAMASEHSSSGPALHEMAPTDLLFQPLFDELLTPPASVDHPAHEVIAPIPEVVAPEPAASTSLPSSTTVDQDAPSPSNSQKTPKTQYHVIPIDVEEEYNHEIDFAHKMNDQYLWYSNSRK
ncbi:retrovirus-related pol polyprotein from transposon TNT 1-94 [Tanacetum coccineum]